MTKRITSIILVTLLVVSLFAFVWCSNTDEMQQKIEDLQQVLQTQTEILTELQNTNASNIAQIANLTEEIVKLQEKINDLDPSKKLTNVDLDISKELADKFKSAYANSISEYVDVVDLNNIEILDCYGKIGNAYIVSMTDSYPKAYPNGAYIEYVENMEFRYDIRNNVYIVYKNALYTAKEAYEKSIITFDNLCTIFGLHTAKLDTFNKEDYDKLNACIELIYQEEAELYQLARYYGEYNGYSVVSYNYLGMQYDVVAYNYINKLEFSYGYQSNYIRFMNKTEMYSINQALSKGIITNQDVYDIFEIHTKSQQVDDDLVETLLTPAYELCLKYKDDFYEELKYEKFYLTKYYGKYGNSYIYSLCAPWIKSSSTAPTTEEMDIMDYGFAKIAYVLNDGKIYTLNQAKEEGMITEEIVQEIEDKYYNKR